MHIKKINTYEEFNIRVNLFKLLNYVKQKYFVKLWLFDNRMNLSNLTVVAIPSLL